MSNNNDLPGNCISYRMKCALKKDSDQAAQSGPSSLSDYTRFVSIATHRELCEETDMPARVQRLICVFDGRTYSIVNVLTRLKYE